MIPIPSASAPIVADHTAVDKYTDIPQYWIDEVKKMWVNVPGESHSSGYRNGLDLLETLDSRFQVSRTETGVPEAYTDQHLRISRATWTGTGWLYSYGEEDWYTNAAAINSTKNHLTYSNTHNLTIAAMGFGWCWDMSWHNLPGGGIDPVYQVRWAGASVGSPEVDLRWGLDAADQSLTGNSVSLDTYLNATQQYIDYIVANNYPTKVFFTTGPVDSYNTGENGYQRYLKQERIRDYAITNGGILFDYGDILVWGDDGTRSTTTWTDYGGTGRTFPQIHPDNMKDLDGSYIEDGDHIGQRGAVRLAKAMWWILARIAGWDGVPGGNGKPIIGVADSYGDRNDRHVDFGNVGVGKGTVSGAVTVTNEGTAPLSIGAIAGVDPLASPFLIASDNCSGKVLPPAGACKIVVGITPLTRGTFQDSFDIPSDDPDLPTVTVKLSGRGTTYSDPASTPYSVFLVGNPTLMGTALQPGDELVAFSVHPRPGAGGRWETTVAGHAVVTPDGSLPTMAVYGDDPAVPRVVEGCVPGEEIQLALWSASDRKLYVTYVDNTTGLAPVLAWTDNAASLSVDLDFVPGNRYPLRNGAWNLFSHGVLKGYYRGSIPTKPQLQGVTWENVTTMANAFPFKSLGSKLDRVVGNDGSGNKLYLSGLGGTMTYFAPGYGYWIKMKTTADNQVLSWMTVPGSLSAGTESLTFGADNAVWTLGGYWGNEVTYNLSGYDAASELLPVSASDNVMVSPMGQVWTAITGSYDRVVTTDGAGNHIYLPGLPSQIVPWPGIRVLDQDEESRRPDLSRGNEVGRRRLVWNPSLPQTRTLRYLGPGSGYWIKMNPSGGTLTYPPGTK